MLLTSQNREAVNQASFANAREVVLAAVENPPRTCEMQPIAALIPDVLARYGLNTDSALLSDAVSAAKHPAVDTGTSIDVSV